jgi:hypothetical protein
VSVLVGVSHGTGKHEASMTSEQHTAAFEVRPPLLPSCVEADNSGLVVQRDNLCVEHMRSQNCYRSLSPPCHRQEKPQIHYLWCDGLLDGLLSVFYFLDNISMPASVVFLGQGPAWSLHCSGGRGRLHICPFCHKCYIGLDFGHSTCLYCSRLEYETECENFDCSAAVLR